MSKLVPPTIMSASILLAVLMAVAQMVGTAAAHKVYPRDYFIAVKLSKFPSMSTFINATGCETLLSSNQTGHFLVSCPTRRSDKFLRIFRFNNILDVSPDTLPKVTRLPKRRFHSNNRRGRALFRQYSNAALYPYSWHLRAMGADAAWKKGFNGAGVTVAGILTNDVGTYCAHPALASNLDTKRAFSFTKQPACVNTTDSRTSLYASGAASLVMAGNANYTGIAPGARYFPVRMENTDDDAAFALSVLYAAAAGADLIVGSGRFSDTRRNDTRTVRLYRTTFRAMERLGALLVVETGYDLINPDNAELREGIRNGTVLTFTDMGRSVVPVRGTQHDREWCPKVKNFTGIYPPAQFAAELAATCGNSSYVNQYTNMRPFTGFNPRKPDTLLTYHSNAGKPQLCSVGQEAEPVRYAACGDDDCKLASYNVYTAYFPVAENTSDDYYPGAVLPSYAPAITSSAAALLLQAYPEVKGNPYALRLLLLSAARPTARATKIECGAGFLNLRNIFG